MSPRLAIALLLLLCAAFGAHAHEVRPAYLELREVAPDRYAVLWKTPMLGEARLGLSPVFPDTGHDLTPRVTRTPPGASITEWSLAAPALRGQTVAIPALSATMTDALVRIEF